MKSVAIIKEVLSLSHGHDELWLNFADGSKCKYDPQAIEGDQKIKIIKEKKNEKNINYIIYINNNYKCYG